MTFCQHQHPRNTRDVRNELVSPCGVAQNSTTDGAQRPRPAQGRETSISVSITHTYTALETATLCAQNTDYPPSLHAHRVLASTGMGR